MSRQQPRIALISTGGTIDSLGRSRTDLAFYTEARDRLPEGELLELVPEVAEVAQVTLVPFERVPSYGFTPEKWSELANLVQGLMTNPACDGVVLSHGTNSLEETALVLSLTIDCVKPVVIVGAMRPINGLSSDGPLNLLQAVRLASSDDARGHGVLVTLNDTIFAARDVTKTATFRADAFGGGDLGPIGHVQADGEVDLRLRHLTNSQRIFDVDDVARMPRVDVVVSYVGADGALIDAAVDAGARGIVSAGTGGGRPTADEDDALRRASLAGVVVCQASRVATGKVLRSPQMRSARRVTAGAKPAWQARVALSLALTRTADPTEVQTLLDQL
jgi:L-asparaginase